MTKKNTRKLFCWKENYEWKKNVDYTSDLNNNWTLFRSSRVATTVSSFCLVKVKYLYGSGLQLCSLSHYFYQQTLWHASHMTIYWGIWKWNHLGRFSLVWLDWMFGMSAIVCYLMPDHLYTYDIQFVNA